MGDNVVLVVAGTCGLGLACLGALIGGAVFLMSGKTGEVLEALASFLPGWNDDREDDVSHMVQKRRSTVNLRAKAKSVDFDDALAKYGGAAPEPPADRSYDVSQPPPDPTFDDGDELAARQRKRLRERRRYNRRYSDDEVFGGLLDDDGDGRPDY